MTDYVEIMKDEVEQMKKAILRIISRIVRSRKVVKMKKLFENKEKKRNREKEKG